MPITIVTAIPGKDAGTYPENLTVITLRENGRAYDTTGAFVAAVTPYNGDISVSYDTNNVALIDLITPIPT